MSKILMPFYEALGFLLTTPRGAKITRKCWSDMYLFKKYDNKNKKWTICISDGKNFESEYTASSDSIVANDWYIIVEEDE